LHAERLFHVVRNIRRVLPRKRREFSLKEEAGAGDGVRGFELGQRRADRRLVVVLGLARRVYRPKSLQHCLDH
jgi:hypothetical protein